MLYIFELGRERDLARAEILSICENRAIPINRLSENDAFFYLDTDTIDIPDMMKTLGSTISIGEQLTKLTDTDTITDTIDNLQSVGKIHFSLRGTKSAKRTALEIKKQLKARGRSVRYVEAKNTATIIHNGLVEKQGDFIITDQGLFVTRAVQDIEAFAKRDRDRPGVDARSGMLPPKLARTMVNLAGQQKNAIIYDPFCGSGTILTEAALSGYQTLYGSDLSQKAVNDTRKNLLWIGDAYGKSFSSTVFVSDARQVPRDLPEIDAIIPEPYLGKPLRGVESHQFLQRQAEELKELFVPALREMRRILTKSGVIVFVVPHFKYKDTWIEPLTKKDIENLGFSVDELVGKPYIRYHRPDQHLGRAIYRLMQK